MRIAILTFVLVCTACIAGEPIKVPPPPPPPPMAADEPWKKELLAKLDRKVTFEFVETPLADAFDFLRSLTNVTLLVEPESQKHLPPISLRVTDTPVTEALNWICRMTRLKWELQDHALYISFPKDVLAEFEQRQDIAELKQLERHAKQLDRQRALSTAKLHVKLPDGREIEAEGLNPSSPIAAQILDQVIDPARDGMLSLRLPRELPGVTHDDLLALLKKIVPTANTDYDPKTRLLIIRAGDAVSLRRANSLLRDLGMKRQPRPPLQVPGHDADGRVFDMIMPDREELQQFNIPLDQMKKLLDLEKRQIVVPVPQPVDELRGGEKKVIKIERKIEEAPPSKQKEPAPNEKEKGDF